MEAPRVMIISTAAQIYTVCRSYRIVSLSVAFSIAMVPGEDDG
jgi:hypothetical protein